MKTLSLGVVASLMFLAAGLALLCTSPVHSTSSSTAPSTKRRVTVEIPLAVVDGMSDTTQITVTSAINPSFGRTSSAMTTAKARRVYLPIALKGWGP